MTGVRIPSDIDQEDRLIGSLSGRQLIIVAVPAVVLWCIYLVTRSWLPAPVLGCVAILLIGASVALIVGSRDAMTMDRYVVAGLRFMRSTHLFVSAPDGLEKPPAFLGAIDSGPALAPLGLGPIGVRDDGLVDLGTDGMAVICEASSVNFALQSKDEQELLVESFGRFCNSVTTSFQILIRPEPIELGEAVASLRAAARSVPSLELERACLGHAEDLSVLNQNSAYLTRRVFIVLRDARTNTTAGATLSARVHQVAEGLGRAGIEIKTLDRAAARSLLQRACDPFGDLEVGSGYGLVTGGSR